MKIFRFDPDVGKPFTAFASRGVIQARILRTAGSFLVNCVYVGGGGHIGPHAAPVPQLLLVVQGEGWVQVEGAERVPVAEGRAAFIQKGERHQAGSDGGMMALVVEGELVDPQQLVAAD